MDGVGGEFGVEGEKIGVENWEETHSCFCRKSGFFQCKISPYVIFG